MKHPTFRAITAFFVLFCITPCFSGCGGVRGIELSQRLIVEAIGIDTAKEGVTVSLQTLDTHSAGRGEDPNSAGNVTRTLAFTGKTVGEALSRIESATGLTPLYSQARILIFGRQLAENGLQQALDFFLREYTTRSDILIALAEGSAQEIVYADFGASVPGALILEDMLTCGNKNGDNPAVKLYRFMNLSLTETDAAYCPILGLTDVPDGKTKTPVLRGTAFFGAQKLRFAVNSEQTRGLLFLTDDVERATLSVRGKKGVYSLRVIRSKTKIKTRRLEDAGFGFTINVSLRCDITEYLGETAGTMTSAEIRDAQNAGQRHISALLTESFRTLFFGRHADICRFARSVGFRYPKAAARYAEHMFSDAISRVDLAVQLTIRRVGKENIVT